VPATPLPIDIKHDTTIAGKSKRAAPGVVGAPSRKKR
jgi:hypothetical protein